MAIIESTCLQEVQSAQRNELCTVECVGYTLSNSTANLLHSIILVNWFGSCWNHWSQNCDHNQCANCNHNQCQICDHNWLAEELPKSHPGARFLIFRDQARVAQNSEHEKISLGQIKSTARELLSECELLRPDLISEQSKDSSRNAHFASSRPLIFICRGLGGLLVKEVYDTTDISFRSTADYKVTLGIACGRKPEWKYLNCSSNMRDCMASQAIALVQSPI